MRITDRLRCSCGMLVRDVAPPASQDYSACAMSTQYTIRAVPRTVDRAVRKRVKRESKSLDAVIIEAISHRISRGPAFPGSVHLGPSLPAGFASCDRLRAEISHA